jgi:hypothetical protein
VFDVPQDISYDKENVVIPCVNTINHHEYPAYVEYLTERVPTSGVRINTDPSFRVCCECTDGCQNISKCACRQLTLEVRVVCRWRHGSDVTGDNLCMTPYHAVTYWCNIVIMAW